MAAGVLFDLYGTLLEYGDMRRAWSDWLQSLYISLGKLGLSISRRSFAEHCDGFFGLCQPPRENGLSTYELRIRRLCSELGIDAESEAIHTMATESINSWHNEIRLSASALPTLQAIHKTRKIALVTNFDHAASVHSVISALKIRAYLDVIVISDEVGVKKPDPAIFDIALKRLGLDTNEVVHIGDSLEDINGAVAAGIRPILLGKSDSLQNQIGRDFAVDEEAGWNPRIDCATAVIGDLDQLLSVL